MSIETIGNLQTILKNHKANIWTKKTDQLNDFNWPKINLNESQKSTPSFFKMFSESIGEVNNLQKEANKSIQKLITGKSKNIHETMLAVEKAEISFKAMNTVRQKVIDAYKEVMHMQI